jgi:hypothetical protein
MGALGTNIDIELDKNDYNDAVITAFIFPKYRRRIDVRFLNCWPYMTLWRRARRIHKAYRQLLKATPPPIKKKLQQLMRAIIPTKKSPTDFDEVRLELFATSFVESVMKNYPEYEIGKLFERLEVGDDASKHMLTRSSSRCWVTEAAKSFSIKQASGWHQM